MPDSRMSDTPFSLWNNPFLVFDSDVGCLPCVLLGDVSEEARVDCKDGGDVGGGGSVILLDAISGSGVGKFPDKPYLDCKAANAAE
jgi:hypothetical protein